MDRIEKLFSLISDEEKNSVLFDKVGNFTFKEFRERVFSYSTSLINSFILSYDSGPFLELLLLLKEENVEEKKFRLKEESFKVVHPSKKRPQLEERDGQKLFRENVENILKDNTILVAEAPPGIGKTLAYLLPMMENIDQKRFLISTNTKSLQEQIFVKDIKLASYNAKKSFSVINIKGISNYFCFSKYYENMENFHPLMKLATEGFIQISNTGDVNTLKFIKGITYDDITCDSGYCQDNECPFSNICFYLKLKEKVLSSQIVVTNHYLCLIDETLPKSILGDFDMIVFDEAHNLENVISDVYSYSLDFFEIFKILKYFVKKIKDHLKTIEESSLSFDCYNFFTEILSYLTTLYENFEIMYENILEKVLQEEKEKDIYDSKIFENIKTHVLKTKQLLYSIRENGEKTTKILKDSKFKNLEIKQNIKYLVEESKKIYESFIVITEANNSDYAFYYEMNTRTKNLVLYAMLVNTGEQFSNFLRKKDKSSIVFTSATLKTSNDFEFFKERVGVGLSKRKYKEEVFVSSFDYEKQMEIFCFKNIGDPNSEQFMENVVTVIKKLEEKRKRTLVLTTSYQQIDYLKENLKDPKFIFQIKEGNNEKILLEYKSKKNSILVGTNTFWEGVDLPGDLLEILVIVKLPFLVPDDPVFIKKSENLKNRGLDPFFDYSLPYAILKLKQGMGRLIRSKDDSGEIYILDERVITKKYGKRVVSEFFVQPKILDFNELIGV
ncbi:MAG: helicase C-terminal domain-containing protein [candidate division WOR-3 bacterium]